MKIKKGDKVKVIAGDDKGVVGEVVAVLPKSNRVIVEGVNVNKKHEKPNNANPDGGIVNKELPINASNVKLVDAGKKDGKASKAKAKTTKKATKKSVKGDKK